MTASDKNSLSSSEPEPSQNHTIRSAIYQPSLSPAPTFRTPWNFETDHTAQAPVICSASTLKSLPQALAFITATLEDHSEELDEGIRVKFTDVSSVLGPQIIAALVEDEDCFRKKYRRFRKCWNSKDRVLWFKRPTRLHNSIQRCWTRYTIQMQCDGLITPDERNEIDGNFGTTVYLPTSPYAQSTKEPDVLVCPEDGLDMPSIVIECGLSEPATELETDAEISLRGSAGQTKVAIFVKFRLDKAHRTVYGEASVWELDSMDKLVRRQTETVFPPPAQHKGQALYITRGEIWRGSLAPTRNPLERLSFSVDLLRSISTKPIVELGLRPAQ